MYMLLTSEIIINDQELPQVGGGGQIAPLAPPTKKHLIELTISALEPLAREVAHTATDLQLAI